MTRILHITSGGRGIKANCPHMLYVFHCPMTSLSHLSTACSTRPLKVLGTGYRRRLDRDPRECLDGFQRIYLFMSYISRTKVHK